MKLTKEEATNVVYGDNEDFNLIKDTEKIVDKSRWTITKEAVFKHSNGKYYKFHWYEGSTESQDDTEAFYSDYEPTEVELKEVTVMQWVEVKNNNESN